MKLLSNRAPWGSVLALSALVAMTASACGDDTSDGVRSPAGDGASPESSDSEGVAGADAEGTPTGGTGGSTKPGTTGAGGATSNDAGEGGVGGEDDEGATGDTGGTGGGDTGGTGGGDTGGTGGEPEPEPCAAGTWDDDADPWTACVAHTTCGVGLEEDEPGTPSTDRSCRPTWPLQFGTPSGDGAYRVAVDGNGDIIVVGWANQAFPGFTSAGGQDGYVRKFSSTGVVLWTRQFGSTGHEVARAVTVNEDDEIFVTGYVSGVMDGQPAFGGTDVFLRKYSPTGDLAWSKTFGNANNQYGRGVAVASDGSIYVAGYTQSALDGQAAVALAAFLRKHDASGNLVWTRQFGGSGSGSPGTVWANAFTVAVNSAGEILIGGDAQPTLAGQTSAGVADAFVRKYNSAGTIMWTHQFGSTSGDSVQALAIDDDGDIYAVGNTSAALPGQVHKGGIDAFVRKIDSAAGTHEWTRQLGTTERELAHSAALDAEGNVYAVGLTEGSLSGAVLGGTDAYIAKYESDGDADWIRQFGTNADDDAAGVVSGSGGLVYVVGQTRGVLPNQGPVAGLDSTLFRFDADGNSP